MIERFSTLNLHPLQRLDFWNSLCDEALAGTCVDSSAASFRATMLRWNVGPLTLLRPRSDASKVWRAPAHDAARADKLVLHIQHRGSGLLSQAGHDAYVKAGELILNTVDEGYRFALSQDHELHVVEMPMQPLRERVPRLDDHLRVNIASSPAARLFHEFVLSLWRHGDLADALSGWADEVTRTFYDLLAMALVHRADSTPSGDPRRQPLLQQAQAYVESNLSTVDLATRDIANHLNVSVRTVQNLFAVIATTPSNYILERRLLHAGDRLRMETGASISAIAFDLGFNDSAYFSRCFRDRYGMAPRTWREQ